MDYQPLFLDTAPSALEKTAGMLTRLGDNADQWPEQVMQEIYKSRPFLSEFDVHVALDKVNEEKGYAFGSIEVRPKVTMTSQEASKEGIRAAHIPVIIKDQMLQPLDVFMLGKVYQPLTESRLRSCMFRPNTFDSARERPPEYSFVGELQPPNHAGGVSLGGVKTGSAQLLLPQLQGRVLTSDKQKLASALKEANVQTALLNAKDGVRAAFSSAQGLEPIDLNKTASYLRDRVRPNVVQFTKLANGNYLMKWANTGMYDPRTQELPPSVANEVASYPDLVTRVENDGSVTVSPDAAIKSTLAITDIRKADQFGMWSVQDTVGNTLVGWVFPKVMSLSMQPLPLTLFTNGSQYALQEAVAGKMEGKSTDIPRGTPKGYGCLYYTEHGEARAFIPMTVTSSFNAPSGLVNYVGHTDLGEHVSFSFSEGLKTVVNMGNGEYAVPGHFAWLPLKGSVELVSEPTLFSKVANKQWTGTFELLGDTDVFSFRGAPVAKLAAVDTQFVNRNQAEFLCGALGLTPDFTKEALNRAAGGELLTLGYAPTIIPAREKMASALQDVRKELSELNPPIHNFKLFKEAAILDDALTVDKVLGLGFINSENVSTFVDMIPGLEIALSRLSEMLIAARLGLKEIPESSLERMMSALDDVILGLRALRQKEEGV